METLEMKVQKGIILTNVMPDVSKIIEKDPIEENTIKNETIQPDIPQNVVTYSKTQISLLCVTVISFHFHYYFFQLFFIKHQQKMQEKKCLNSRKVKMVRI